MGMGKDKNAPKRSLSAYMLFCNANRATATKKHPNLKMTELSTVLSKMWKEATAAQKKPFETQAAKDKKVYQEKLAKYKESPEYANFKASNDTASLVRKVCKKIWNYSKRKERKIPK